jgi:hypothetical protein
MWVLPMFCLYGAALHGQGRDRGLAGESREGLKGMSKRETDLPKNSASVVPSQWNSCSEGSL